MRAYVGQTRSRKLIARLALLGIGECVQPREWPPRRRPWFLDNGAFAAHKAGSEWEQAPFISAIASAKSSDDPPDFVVVPDVVADAAATRTLGKRWLPFCRQLAPAFLAIQDGMRPEEAVEITAGFDGVFIGGSTSWKLSTGGAWARAAHAIGLPVHIGRVGSGKRIAWARRIGADSIDSCLPLWGERNMSPFLNSLLRPQFDLFAEQA